jgi:6,7-dimethyl-8-ribityllumazine synthase
MKKDSPSSLPRADHSWRVAIIASSFYPGEMDALIASAREALGESGMDDYHISIHRVPGSFEVPLIGAAIAEANTADALIGLGIIVEGDTHHANLLARESARGIMDVQLRYNIPFAFEILYVDSIEDARKRLEKGREAANAVLGVLHTIRCLKKDE